MIADRHHGAAELLVDHGGHGQVDSAGATDDAFETGDGADQGAAGEVTGGQQEEQHGQGGEHELLGTRVVDSTYQHEQGEDTPQQQIPAHVGVRGGFGQTHGRHHQQEHQAQPEETVGDKGGDTEGVATLVLHDTRDDLGHTAVAQAHGQDHGADGEETCVMDVQQDSGHTETHQTQRGRVGQFFAHVAFSKNRGGGLTKDARF